MEQKKQLGGKRRGAGRKPVLSKKKQFSFYVEGSQVIRFGSEEKFKKAVTDFIYGFGKEVNYENPVSELNSLPNYSVQNINLPLATSPTPVTYTGPVKPQTDLKSVAQWVQEKRELVDEEDFIAWEQKLDADTLLTDKQKKLIKIS